MSRSEKDDEQMERRQRRSDAGLLSERYPDISSIVVSMDYYQGNTGLVFIKRTVNFFPSSAAYFLMECVRHDCIDGGYNLESVITNMARDRLESRNGELVCTGDNLLNPSGHARINYTIAIHYSN